MAEQREPKFKVGDKVLVGGNLVAEIEYYDDDEETSGIVVYKVESGGSVRHVTGRTANTRIEKLPSGREDDAKSLDEVVGNTHPTGTGMAEHVGESAEFGQLRVTGQLEDEKNNAGLASNEFQK